RRDRARGTTANRTLEVDDAAASRRIGNDDGARMAALAFREADAPNVRMPVHHELSETPPRHGQARHLSPAARSRQKPPPSSLASAGHIQIGNGSLPPDTGPRPLIVLRPRIPDGLHDSALRKQRLYILIFPGKKTDQ